MPVTSKRRRYWSAHLGDPTEALPAPAGVVEGREAEPGRELTARAELGGIRDGGRDGARSEQAYARHGGNASGKLVRSERGQQVSLELPNAALDCDGLFGQGTDHLGGKIRDLVRVAGHRAPDECQGVRDALRDVDAELG